MVWRNFLDEKVFFLHVAIVLTYFQSEKITKLTWFVAKLFAESLYKTCKNEFRDSKAKKGHASVILNSHFAWIFTKALFYILSRLSASTFLRKALNCHESCNHERIRSSDLKPEVDASLNITCRKVMITYWKTKLYHFKNFYWLVQML